MCYILLVIKSEKFEVLKNIDVNLDGGGKRELSLIKNRYIIENKKDDLQTDHEELQVCAYF